MTRQASDIPTALFGAWDGAISVLAVLIASSHLGAQALLVAGIGGAIGGCLSMGSGQFESMEDTTAVKLRTAVIMAVATLAGGLLPALPFLATNKTVGYVIGLAAVIVLATAVWIVKWKTDVIPGGDPLVKAIQAYLLLGVTIAATVAVSIVLV
jgi:VIT1/CCC1 family predicted Fe2+/Mn2+ transporter